MTPAKSPDSHQAAKRLDEVGEEGPLRRESKSKCQLQARLALQVALTLTIEVVEKCGGRSVEPNTEFQQ
jgi:hypothetical protein